jgi:xanthine dehydrogenase accessory factor
MPRTSEMKSIYKIIDEIEQKGESAALCIVTDTRGSTPLKPGAKMVVWPDGSLFGTIGGGNLEHKVISDALEVIKTKAPVLKHHNLVQDHQMCCGGTVTVYIEALGDRQKLIIFGAGHVGKQVARLAANLPFGVSLADSRHEFLQDLDEGINPLHGSYEETLKTITFDQNTFVVICTHLHKFDRDILAWCINKPHRYLGMIGSKRKVLVTRKLFLEKGIAEKDQLDNVDMPMGFDIGGNTPGEIAISIAAKLIAVKNNKNLIKGSTNIVAYDQTDSDYNRCG